MFTGFHCKRQVISESYFWYQPNSRDCEYSCLSFMKPEHCQSSF